MFPFSFLLSDVRPLLLSLFDFSVSVSVFLLILFLECWQNTRVSSGCLNEGLYLFVCRWRVSEEMLRVFWRNRHRLPQEVLPSPRDKRQRDQEQRRPPVRRQDSRPAECLGGEGGHRRQFKRPPQSVTWFESKANGWESQRQSYSQRSLLLRRITRGQQKRKCHKWCDVLVVVSIQDWLDEHPRNAVCSESFLVIHFKQRKLEYVVSWKSLTAWRVRFYIVQYWTD